MKVPSPLLATVPLLPWLKALMLAGVRALSTSLSLSSTLAVVTGVSSLVLALSFTATGASLTGATVITWLAVAVPPLPSLITYGKVTIPLKSAFGVKVITPPELTLTTPPVTLID